MLDWLLAGVTLLVCLYPVLPVRVGSGGGGYNAFLDRQGLLEPVDVAMGALLLVLVLEACRRTTGWALPIVCGLFLAYGYYGLPTPGITDLLTTRSPSSTSPRSWRRCRR